MPFFVFFFPPVLQRDSRQYVFRIHWQLSQRQRCREDRQGGQAGVSQVSGGECRTVGSHRMSCPVLYWSVLGLCVCVCVRFISLIEVWGALLFSKLVTYFKASNWHDSAPTALRATRGFIKACIWSGGEKNAVKVKTNKKRGRGLSESYKVTDVPRHFTPSGWKIP